MHRCDCYEIEIPPADALVARAQVICKAEGVSISDAKLKKMIADVGGSVRGTIRGLEKLVLDAKK
jgi:DNA polymerase III delta prime subunit